VLGCLGLCIIMPFLSGSTLEFPFIVAAAAVIMLAYCARIAKFFRPANKIVMLKNVMGKVSGFCKKRTCLVCTLLCVWCF
jgi:hypothetical protein